jgi:hypothetical protein
MKPLDIIFKILLVILMLLSLIGMLVYSKTMDQFILYWALMMIAGAGDIVHTKMITKNK